MSRSGPSTSELLVDICGVSLNATRSIATAAPFELDTLIVAGSPGIDNPASRPCVDWLRQATGGIRRVGGICTGVFLLAEAGLLDGCRAVTHWAFCDELARRYPSIQVEPDPIFLRDGRFYTTAGMTAGMDLALTLVQDDLGRDVAKPRPQPGEELAAKSRRLIQLAGLVVVRSSVQRFPLRDARVSFLK
jgi:transcriptional regulator GlxA family with amidase domain